MDARLVGAQRFLPDPVWRRVLDNFLVGQLLYNDNLLAKATCPACGNSPAEAGATTGVGAKTANSTNFADPGALTNAQSRFYRVRLGP